MEIILNEIKTNPITLKEIKVKHELVKNVNHVSKSKFLNDALTDNVILIKYANAANLVLQKLGDANYDLEFENKEFKNIINDPKIDEEINKKLLNNRRIDFNSTNEKINMKLRSSILAALSYLEDENGKPGELRKK